MSWVLAFAGFAVLIILHEAGHFTAAKAVGMRVERFFLFFPPKVWSVKRGETEYGIGAIPLGGFVKITGHEPGGGARPRRGRSLGPRALLPPAGLEADRRDRGGPVVNIVIAFVILFFLAFGARAEATNTDRRASSNGTPAAPRAPAAATGSSRSTARPKGDLDDQLRSTRSRPTSAPATQTDGCKADRAGEDRRRCATASQVTVHGDAGLRRGLRAPAARLHSTATARRSTRGPGRRPRWALDRCGTSPRRRSASSAGSSTPRSASRSRASSAPTR